MSDTKHAGDGRFCVDCAGLEKCPSPSDWLNPVECEGFRPNQAAQQIELLRCIAMSLDELAGCVRVGGYFVTEVQS